MIDNCNKPSKLLEILHNIETKLQEVINYLKHLYSNV